VKNRLGFRYHRRYLDALLFNAFATKINTRRGCWKNKFCQYTGTGVNIRVNRNTFHGAELLSISVFGGVEVQVSGQNVALTSFWWRGKSYLKICAPIKLNHQKQIYPKTKATLGYEFQNRTNFISTTNFKRVVCIWKENTEKNIS
jgi:hypothetical protein